jgi:hypothetical protein
MNNNLQIAKDIIAEHIEEADCGLYNTRNTANDDMTTIYAKDGLMIDICYDCLYFEVFGLTNLEFLILHEYYDALCGGLCDE